MTHSSPALNTSSPQQDDEEPPPFWHSWKNIYLGVGVYLAAVIIVLYILTRTFLYE